jgi:CheY-like chemotaxis protein
MNNYDIMIVMAEDDQGHASLIERNFKAAGLGKNIFRCSDGIEALEFFLNIDEYTTRKFVLILDIKMPRMNGIDVLKKIKADKRLKKMPVIMFTTTDDEKDIQLCHNYGCNAYITKPMEYESFVNVISSLSNYIKILKIPYIN